MRTLFSGVVMAVVVALVGCGAPGGNDGGSGGGSGGSGGSAGCADPTGPDYDCTGSTTVVKTGAVWTDVISPKCISTCHSATGVDVSYGNYSTAALFHSQNVGVKSLYAGAKATLKKIDPNSPQNSSIWLKVIGGSTNGKKGPQCELTGNQMPDGQPALTAAEKAELKNWICTGATQ